MARPSLRFSLPALLLLIASILPGAALASPEADADRALEAASAALPTPSLQARLQARAAAYRVVLDTAERFGLDEDAVAGLAAREQAPAEPVVVAVRAARR